MNLLIQYKLCCLELSNRMVIAPMTRCRAVEGNVPSPLAVTYYVQRASAGLIVTEGSQVSPQGVGYICTPGIHSPLQVAGWKKVTEAVHGAGGKIFLQLWHVRRVSHPDFLGGEPPVAPSELPFEGEVHTPSGIQIYLSTSGRMDRSIPLMLRPFTQARRRVTSTTRKLGY